MAVVAHYDTAPGTVGATDNASGVAVLLELARLFKTIERDYSVDFIAFGAEEFRGTGAKEYAKKHKKEFKNISLCWNMDCLGTVLGRNILQVRKARKMADILKREFPDVHVEHFDAPGGHDARVFSENKVPVVYFHTQWDQFPQIHSPNDNLTRINFNKLADMCEISFHILKDFFVRFYTN